MEHTKEPWSFEKECVGNYQISHDHSGAGTVEVIASAVTESNARRIAACVNACAGIKTSDLEAMRGTSILSKANHSCDMVEKQRDELLATLKELLPYTDDLQDEGPEGEGWKSKDLMSAISAAESAIAKAEQS